MDNNDEKNNNDLELWKHVTKDVTPLKKNNTQEKKQEPEKPRVSEPKKTTPVKQAPPIEQKRSPAQPKQPAQIDRRTAQRLQRGQMHIEGRLDLHGKTQNEAYDALARFIISSQTRGKRCVLVITGKGGQRNSTTTLADQGVGVLKQKTPEWLSTPPLNEYVLKIEKAKPKDGGEGALYVLLKKSR